jgi:hypothetical protein
VNALLLSLMFSAAAPSTDIYAVIVGYNGGSEASHLPTLRFADDDALKFYRWFSGITSPDNIVLLTELDETTRASVENPPPMLAPTRTALLGAIKSLEQKLAAHRGAVFFIYAGHGLPGRFLLQPEASGEAAFTGRELRAAFSSLNADRSVLFLDACRAQSLFAERGEKDFSAEVMALEHGAENSPLGILTASSTSQNAGEAASLGGGYFSHVLASGLAGAADADNDGFIRFGELAAFVAFNTEHLFGQRPWFEAPGGDLRSVVVDLTGRPGVTFDPALAGQLKVRDPQGRMIAELNKARGARASLVIPPGHYRVEHGTDSAEIEVVDQRVSLEPAAFSSGAIAARGDEDFDGFQMPFGSEVVSALSAGYHSGVEVSQPGGWTHEIDAAYALTPAPFGLPAVEHGLDVGYRLHLFEHLVASVHGSFHSANFPHAALYRAGALFEAGWQFRPSPRVDIVPHLGLGMQALWHDGEGGSHADYSIPQLSAGVRAEVAIASGFAAFFDARADLAFIALDGVRSAFFFPQLSVGAAWRK